MNQIIKDYIASTVSPLGQPCMRCGRHMSRPEVVENWIKFYRINCADCERLIDLQERQDIAGLFEDNLPVMDGISASSTNQESTLSVSGQMK